jgi:membrane dipeptidase
MKFADLHCDTLSKVYSQNKNNLYQNDCQISLNKLCKYEKAIQVFAIWLSNKYLSYPFQSTIDFIEFFHQQIENYKTYIDNHDLNLILSIEGGEALEGKIENIEKFYELDVRLLTITWNHDNELGGCVNSHDGLTKFGIEAIKKMNELGMIVDVSHASEETFWDVYKYSNSFFVASHSNCKKICNHARNLTDDQIIAIGERDGLIGINLYSEFIQQKNNTTTIYDVVKHIEYIIKLIGDNNICWGCDFDGADTFPEHIKDVTSMVEVYDLFINLFGKTVSDKIFYNNIYNKLHSKLNF